MMVALVLGALTLQLLPHGTLQPAWLPVALGLLALAWPALRPPDVTRDDTLPALAVLLSSVGLAVVARLQPDLAQKQIVWLAFSLVLAVAAGPAFERFRVLAAYKYIWILCAIALFGALALFGQEVNGARLWIRLGPIQFEPVEVIKLLVVLFMASYLTETADVIARTRPWSLRANAKYLGPLFLGWGISMGILVFEKRPRDGDAAARDVRRDALRCDAPHRPRRRRDGGVRHRARSGRRRTTRTSSGASRCGRIRSTIRSARAIKRCSRCSRSPTAGCSAPASAKAGPTTSPRLRPTTCTPRSARSGARSARSCCCASSSRVVLRALRVAQRQPDLYAKLLATGLAAVFGFQILIIVGGVLHVFPLTGITLPFVSYGGSSLVTNYLLIALVWAISSERRRSQG